MDCLPGCQEGNQSCPRMSWCTSERMSVEATLVFWVKFHQNLKFWKRIENFCCIWIKSAFLKTFCLVRLWKPLSPQWALSTAFLDLFFVTLCGSIPNCFMSFFWFVLHVLQIEHHFFYFTSFAILIWIQT
jgi:hypothetical protein